MKKCFKCNKEYDNSDNFCLCCGGELEQAIECPNCKQSVSEKAKFCRYCGHNLEIKETEAIECPNCKQMVNKRSKFCKHCGHNLEIIPIIVDEEKNTEVESKIEITDEMAKVKKTHNSIIKIYTVIFPMFLILGLLNILILELLKEGYSEYIRAIEIFKSRIDFLTIVFCIVWILHIVLPFLIITFAIIGLIKAIKTKEAKINVTFNRLSFVFYIILIISKVFVRYYLYSYGHHIDNLLYTYGSYYIYLILFSIPLIYLLDKIFITIENIEQYDGKLFFRSFCKFLNILFSITLLIFTAEFIMNKQILTDYYYNSEVTISNLILFINLIVFIWIMLSFFNKIKLQEQSKKMLIFTIIDIGVYFLLFIVLLIYGITNDRLKSLLYMEFLVPTILIINLTLNIIIIKLNKKIKKEENIA